MGVIFETSALHGGKPLPELRAQCAGCAHAFTASLAPQLFDGPSEGGLTPIAWYPERAYLNATVLAVSEWLRAADAVESSGVNSLFAGGGDSAAPTPVNTPPSTPPGTPRLSQLQAWMAEKKGAPTMQVGVRDKSKRALSAEAATTELGAIVRGELGESSLLLMRAGGFRRSRWPCGTKWRPTEARRVEAGRIDTHASTPAIVPLPSTGIDAPSQTFSLPLPRRAMPMSMSMSMKLPPEPPTANSKAAASSSVYLETANLDYDDELEMEEAAHDERMQAATVARVIYSQKAFAVFLKPHLPDAGAHAPALLLLRANTFGYGLLLPGRLLTPLLDAAVGLLDSGGGALAEAAMRRILVQAQVFSI
ncbi:hypothetical protein T492DRAFT_30261 [Pavlovales sp. CCMP2436]|nr:hypothetical protein T492DRAFT_30261 [Pavlovales sp. CCMP2436]